MEADQYGIEQPMMQPQGQTDVDAMYQRSLLDFQDGNWQDAIAGFEEVLRLVPDHAEARAFLEEALMKRGIVPLYAFSRREVVETPLPDGSVKKTQVFRHLGFVTPRSCPYGWACRGQIGMLNGEHPACCGNCRA